MKWGFSKIVEWTFCELQKTSKIRWTQCFKWRTAAAWLWSAGRQLRPIYSRLRICKIGNKDETPADREKSPNSTSHISIARKLTQAICTVIKLGKKNQAPTATLLRESGSKNGWMEWITGLSWSCLCSHLLFFTSTNGNIMLLRIRCDCFVYKLTTIQPWWIGMSSSRCSWTRWLGPQWSLVHFIHSRPNEESIRRKHEL